MAIKHHSRTAGTDISKSAVYGEDHDIEDGTIGAAQIAAGAVTEAKIADGAVTSAKIAADTIVAGDIATGAVGSDELASNAVTTVKIADANVTTAKMSMSNEFTNIGIMEPYFVANGFKQEEIVAPRAWYDSTSGKTFIAYQRGLDLGIMATYYDHSLQTWATPVYVAANTGTNDYHYAPCIAMDDNGYLHTFFGVHGHADLKHYKSNAARSIAAWTNMGNVSVVLATYPNVVRTAANTFYIFYRGTTDVAHLAYVKSTDNMANFGAPTEFADMGYAGGAGYAAYPSDFVYDSNRNAVHFVWYVYDYTNVVNINIYHAYLDLDDGHVYAMDGTDHGTELSKAEADGGVCLVFNSAGNRAESPRVIINSNDSYRPYIMYMTGGAVYATDSHFHFTKWNGAAWAAAVNMVTGATGYALSGDMLWSGTTIRAYLECPVFNWVTEQTGYISVMLVTSADNGATWVLKDIVLNATQAGFSLGTVLATELANSELEVTFAWRCDPYATNLYGTDARMYAAGQKGLVKNRIKW